MNSLGRQVLLHALWTILAFSILLQAGPPLQFEDRRISEQSRKPFYEIDLRYPRLQCCSANPETAQNFNDAMERMVQNRLAYYRAKQLPPRNSPHGGRLWLRSTVTTRRDGVVSVLLAWDCAIAGNFHSNQELASFVFDTGSAEAIQVSSLFRPDVDFLGVLSHIAIADLIRKRKQELHIDPDPHMRK